jgi:hypothetical protein
VGGPIEKTVHWYSWLSSRLASPPAAAAPNALSPDVVLATNQTLSLAGADGLTSIGSAINATYDRAFTRNRQLAAEDAGMLTEFYFEASAIAGGVVITVGGNRFRFNAGQWKNITTGRPANEAEIGLINQRRLAQRTPPTRVPGLSGDRVAHLNRPGYQNYRLETNVGTPKKPVWEAFYHGYIEPGETQAAIRARHAGTVGPDALPRFDPATDRLVMEPGTRLYGEARLMEQRGIVQDQTNIGRVNISGSRRGNNQNGLQPAKLQEYEAWERALNGQ